MRGNNLRFVYFQSYGIHGRPRNPRIVTNTAGDTCLFGLNDSQTHSATSAVSQRGNHDGGKRIEALQALRIVTGQREEGKLANVSGYNSRGTRLCCYHYTESRGELPLWKGKISCNPSGFLQEWTESERAKWILMQRVQGTMDARIDLGYFVARVRVQLEDSTPKKDLYSYSSF
jgi:hypothetical protein